MMRGSGTRSLLAACGVVACGSMAFGQPFRSADGVGNNRANPEWGATGEELLRGEFGAVYVDGKEEMVDRGPARVISNSIAQQVKPVGNRLGLSSMFWQWGQFLDHDFALIPNAKDELIPVVVPADDVFFPAGSMIPVTRNEFHYDGDGVRQFESEITFWIDASNVYGSDRERADALRSYEGGRLLESEPGFLPFNTLGLPNENESALPAEVLYAAGDVRSNEQTGLLTLHTLWMREHNWWANRLAGRHPGWSDERVYQTARAIVGAEVQKIIYEDWLPLLIGEDALPPYRGYDRRVNPNLRDVFSGAAYRIGHTLLNDQLLRFNADGSVFPGGHLELRDAFFDPSLVQTPGSIDAVLRGLAWQEANEVDEQVIDSVRSFLFGFPGDGGLDLIAINTVRGRDMGLPSYNEIREEFGLPRLTSIGEISSDPAVNAKFAAVYPDIDSVDPWVGLMAEDDVPGAIVGETLLAIFTDQFTRLRDGDRYFYLRHWVVRPYLSEIRGTTFADVIRRNSDATEVQDNVFLVPEVGPQPCNVADLSAPFGELDVLDVVAFVDAYLRGDDAADIAPPAGSINVLDVVAFVNAFYSGCP